MKPTQSWKTVPRGTKIEMPETMILKSFNDEVRTVKKGYYYITGFWVDICGLSKKSGDQLNDICIKSTELTNFVGITE